MQIVVMDAFTAKPFTGNPAAGIVLDEPADEFWIKSVARELNLSEMAFVERRGDAFGIRWLTRRWKLRCADTRLRPPPIISCKRV